MANITKVKIKKEYGLQYGDSVTQGYTALQNELLFDYTISPIAKELFISLWALPNDFNFSIESYINFHEKRKADRNSLRQQKDDTRQKALANKTVLKAINELIDAGYLERELQCYKRVGSKTVPIYKYTLFEIPKYLAEAEASLLEKRKEKEIAISIDF